MIEARFTSITSAIAVRRDSCLPDVFSCSKLKSVLFLSLVPEVWASCLLKRLTFFLVLYHLEEKGKCCDYFITNFAVTSSTSLCSLTLAWAIETSTDYLNLIVTLLIAEFQELLLPENWQWRQYIFHLFCWQTKQMFRERLELYILTEFLLVPAVFSLVALHYLLRLPNIDIFAVESL